MRRTAGCALAAMALAAATGAASAQGADRSAVLETYADIAHAVYEDSHATAQRLQAAVARLIEDPTERNLQRARAAWIAARVPYQQSEVYRFGNAVVDAWEGKVNAWPLDEGLIDYVDRSRYGDGSAENALYTANVIANQTLKVGGRTVDASHITPALLRDTLHEFGGIEANVATGYHAVEFLLWGQDLNGTGPGHGERPASDYDPANCTHGHCERRAQYLKTATDMLVQDLAWMTAQWAPGGDAREELLAGDADAGLARMLKGMGSLSYGELAGERIRLGLMLHDPEEEHDCFSDNTHNSHYYDSIGIQNVYYGEYVRIDGRRVAGSSLSDLVAEIAPRVDQDMRAKLTATDAAMQRLVHVAESGKAYDQMIAQGDPHGNRIVQEVVDALTAQTRSIERVVATFKLGAVEFMGSDALDNPAAVFE